MGSELTHLQRSEDALECGDGYSEVCFPVTAEFREQLYGKVLGAYRQVMREVQTAAVQGYGSPPPGPGEEAGYVQMQ